MREKLNENPMTQVALIAVLLVAAAFLMMSALKGGSEEEGEEAPAPTPATSAAITEAEAGSGAQPPPLPPPGSGPFAAPPLPQPLLAAFDANQTVVVLFVRAGGIDDRLTLGAGKRLAAMPGVAYFVVPADRIGRYAAIAQGVSVNRVPALVVMRPKRLTNGVPSASVQYGFQSAASIVQAVVDADYKGPTLSYHP